MLVLEADFVYPSNGRKQHPTSSNRDRAPLPVAATGNNAGSKGDLSSSTGTDGYNPTASPDFDLRRPLPLSRRPRPLPELPTSKRPLPPLHTPSPFPVDEIEDEGFASDELNPENQSISRFTKFKPKFSGGEPDAYNETPGGTRKWTSADANGLETNFSAAATHPQHAMANKVPSALARDITQYRKWTTLDEFGYEFKGAAMPYD